VIQDDKVLYEGYYSGAGRESMLTSFSVDKPFDSALIGIAIDEGSIDSANDPITEYLPELAERDGRFELITIRDLLLMAAGLDYEALRWALFNGDDPLTTYYPDQRELAQDNTQIVDPPAQYFQYNKYHPQLLGVILERTTGMSVTEYTQTRPWDPLGMEFGGAWALDSAGYYKYMWYGRLREGMPSDFAAEGDHGQIIYVSPAHDLIIVRNGTAYGLSTQGATSRLPMARGIPMIPIARVPAHPRQAPSSSVRQRLSHKAPVQSEGSAEGGSKTGIRISTSGFPARNDTLNSEWQGHYTQQRAPLLLSLGWVGRQKRFVAHLVTDFPRTGLEFLGKGRATARDPEW
jgi:CubicO group peptidase (beta-lactamase class C family)